jgi:trk system potassium uptake protein TrkH
MNHRFVIRQIGVLLATLSGALLLIGAWSALLNHGFGDSREGGAEAAFGLSALSGLIAAGLAFALSKGAKPELERREAMLLVSLTWVIGAVLCALPYFFWAMLTSEDLPAAFALRSPVNCYFEAMSGLTTAGATIISGIDQMPRSILLWRALTQWIGGLGIIVLFVAILPSVGAVGKRLFVAETGVTRQGVRPEVRQTARVLWLIYSGLTVVQILALRIAGMSFFDAICHAFSTLATGGFSTRDASAAGFRSPGIEWILILFMVLGGANFGWYYQLVRRRWKAVVADPELRLYLGGLVIVTGLITVTIAGTTINTTAGDTIEPGFVESIRYAAFQTATVQTTTGFATSDFNLWPALAKSALLLLMFVGGCSGSTSGGIKVIRVWIALRTALAEIERAFRPNVVRPLRVSGNIIDADGMRSACSYVIAVILLWVIGTGGLLVLESGQSIDLATAGSATIALFSTVGPGVGRVGAIETYAWLSDPSKLLLCVIMLLGRLEIFALLVLFSIRFWRD